VEDTPDEETEKLLKKENNQAEPFIPTTADKQKDTTD